MAFALRINEFSFPANETCFSHVSLARSENSLILSAKTIFSKWLIGKLYRGGKEKDPKGKGKKKERKRIGRRKERKGKQEGWKRKGRGKQRKKNGEGREEKRKGKGKERKRKGKEEGEKRRKQGKGIEEERKRKIRKGKVNLKFHLLEGTTFKKPWKT